MSPRTTLFADIDTMAPSAFAQFTPVFADKAPT